MDADDLLALMNERDLRYSQRFAAQEVAMAAALAAAEKATTKAEVAAERRFEAVNEFRAQQGDLIAGFLTRTEYEAKHEALLDKVAVLENWRSKTIGAAAVGMLVSGAIGAAVVKAIGG